MTEPQLPAVRDGLAAIARVNRGRLATRNVADFKAAGLDFISPWVF